jgi:hypothetical protein
MKFSKEMQSRIRTFLLGTVCVLLLLSCVGRSFARMRWEDFEDPTTSWRRVGGSISYRLDAHQRDSMEYYTGSRSEHFRMMVGTPERDAPLYLAHDVGRPLADISSFAISLYLRSNRGGHQIFAEVVLPESRHVETQQPLSILIPGTIYNRTGGWQRLQITDFPEAIRSGVWALRLQHGAQVDPENAYVDRILVNVYAGPGEMDVWFDDLDIQEYIAAFSETPQVPSGDEGGGSNPPNPTGEYPTRTPADSMLEMEGRRAEWENALNGSEADAHLIREVGAGPLNPRPILRRGSVLIDDGRPMSPRMIEYRGEPLQSLKRMGFNTVWMAGAPVDEILHMALQERMWIACPPPEPTAGVGISRSSGYEIDERHDRVIAWIAGRNLEEDQLNATTVRLEAVRAADDISDRIIVGEANTALKKYSRSMLLDYMLFGQNPLLSSLPVEDSVEWVKHQQYLIRPGTPIWTTIQTEPSALLLDQWRRITGNEQAVLETSEQAVTLDHMRMAVRAALASGCRGILFESNSPLVKADGSSDRYRVAAIELVNLELEMMEPWIAAGRYDGPASCSEPGIKAFVMSTDRARLVVPYVSDPYAQYAVGRAAADSVSIVVPGVPEDYETYLWTPGSMRPLKTERTAGGVRATVEQFTPSTLIVMSQNPLILHNITKQSYVRGQQAAALRMELTRLRLDKVRTVLSQLPREALPSNPSPEQYLAYTERYLEASHEAMNTRDYGTSFLLAENAEEPLRVVQRATWERMTQSVNDPFATFSPLTTPVDVCFDSLPLHAVFHRGLSSAQFGPNLLQGGDHEDDATWRSSGWEIYDDAMPELVASAELDPVAARTGRQGLKLQVGMRPGEEPYSWIATSPLQIVSPSVRFEEDVLLCFHGWVRLSGPIEGSVDGLMVIDSAGGVATAQRITQTGAWREFTMFRWLPAGVRGNLTIRMSGLGEAWVDDLSMQVVSFGGSPTIATADSQNGRF